MMQDLLWDILESEACSQYYIDDAEKPAFLLLSKYNPLSHGGFELYMNNVALLGRFSSQKKAEDKLRTVISKANRPLKVFKVNKWGSHKGKRQFFADSIPQRPVTT